MRTRQTRTPRRRKFYLWASTLPLGGGKEEEPRESEYQYVQGQGPSSPTWERGGCVACLHGRIPKQREEASRSPSVGTLQVVCASMGYSVSCTCPLLQGGLGTLSHSEACSRYLFVALDPDRPTVGCPTDICSLRVRSTLDSNGRARARH